MKASRIFENGWWNDRASVPWKHRLIAGSSTIGLVFGNGQRCPSLLGEATQSVGHRYKAHSWVSGQTLNGSLSAISNQNLAILDAES